MQTEMWNQEKKCDLLTNTVTRLRKTRGVVVVVWEGGGVSEIIHIIVVKQNAATGADGRA